MKQSKIDISNLSKKPWSELGVYVVHQGSFSFIAINEEEYKNSPQYVGIEYEGNFIPGNIRVRELVQYFKLHGYGEIRSLNDLKLTIQTHVFKNISNIITKAPHEDAGGLEVVLNPTTLLAHQTLKKEYAKIIDFFEFFGFSDEFGGDGIHANMDKVLFGEDITSQRQGFENMLWFLFAEDKFMIEYSGRRKGDQYNADMLYHLGDQMGNLSKKELLKVFKTSKVRALEGLEHGIANKSGSNKYFNIALNKNGRPVVEFRWFGSTQDVDKLMSIIEWSFALPIYCSQHSNEDEISLQAFSQFVKKYSDIYPHLFKDMSNNSYSSKFIKTPVSFEQSSDRQPKASSS